MQKCFGRKRDYFLALIFQKEHLRGKCHVRKKRAVSGVTNLFKWNPIRKMNKLAAPRQWGVKYINQSYQIGLLAVVPLTSYAAYNITFNI